jgi:hypothetical protein
MVRRAQNGNLLGGTSRGGGGVGTRTGLGLGLYGTRFKGPTGPTFTVAPAITPLTYIYPGTVLTCSAGTWTGTPTITFQWYLDGVLVVGAAASTYTPLVADIGKAPTCQVKATVVSGSTIFTASTTEVVRWSPAAMSNKVLWLDASVASSITSAAGLISQWNDLSGAGNHFVQATGAAQPTLSVADAAWNNRNIVRFNGTSTFMTNASLALTSSALIVAAAYILQSTSASSARIAAHGPAGAGDTATGSFTPLARNGSGASARTFLGATAYDQKTISYNQQTQFVVEKTATGLANHQAGSISTEVAIVAAVNTAYSVIGTSGAAGGVPGTNYWNGDLSEYMEATGVLSSTDRDKLAGYLAWKWGPVAMVGRLPAGHPYKTAFP